MECSLRKCSAWRALLAACLAAPGAALAADNGVYLGLSAADVRPDYSVSGFGSGADGDGSGFKAILGFRPVDKFALEANYVDLEADVPLGVACVAVPCPTETAVDTEAVSVSAVGLFALPLVDLFARVGVARWDAEAAFLAPERDGTDATYGAGAQIRVGSFALRLEYERFDFDDDSADSVSVGFTYTFF